MVSARQVWIVAEWADRATEAVDPEQLHRYWTQGKGLKRWRSSKRPWRTLVRLLRKHVGLERAKQMASAWYEEVFGYTPGSDAARVANGLEPRGERVGPG